jgi:hypothetical protein
MRSSTVFFAPVLSLGTVASISLGDPPDLGESPGYEEFRPWLAYEFFDGICAYCALQDDNTQLDHWYPPLRVAEEALAGRSNGMPQSLVDALVAGWVRLDEDTDHYLNVWAGPGWFASNLSYGHHTFADMHQELVGPCGWQDLTDPERAALLHVWPSVVAWRAGGQAPWGRAESPGLATG